jgi:hypothetical protein
MSAQQQESEMGLFSCPHGRNSGTCGLCNNNRNTDRTVQTVAAGFGAQIAADHRNTGRVVDAHYRTAQAHVDALHETTRAKMVHDEHLHARQLAENQRLAAEQRVYEQQQALSAEAEELAFLEFKEQVVQHGRSKGREYEDWEIKRVWLDTKRRQREETAQRIAHYRVQFDEMVRGLLVGSTSTMETLSAERARIQQARQLTVSARWTPWAVGLAIWTWLILLNCGFLVSLIGLLVGGGYAAHLIGRRRRAFGPEERKQTALFGSIALPVVLLASGATAVLSVSGVLVGLISLGLGAWTLQRRSQFQGLQAELAEVDSQMAAAQDERRNIDALTFEAVLKQQGITV